MKKYESRSNHSNRVYRQHFTKMVVTFNTKRHAVILFLADSNLKVQLSKQCLDKWSSLQMKGKGISQLEATQFWTVLERVK